MPYCESCGQSVTVAANYCSNCGRKQNALPLSSNFSITSVNADTNSTSIINCGHCKGTGKNTSACCHKANGTKYDGLWGGNSTRCCTCGGTGKVRV